MALGSSAMNGFFVGSFYRACLSFIRAERIIQKSDVLIRMTQCSELKDEKTLLFFSTNDVLSAWRATAWWLKQSLEEKDDLGLIPPLSMSFSHLSCKLRFTIFDSSFLFHRSRILVMLILFNSGRRSHGLEVGRVDCQGSGLGSFPAISKMLSATQVLVGW